MIKPSTFLQRALLADAVMSGAMGMLLAIAATPLSGLFALPEALVRETGLLLIPYALMVGYLGLRTRLSATIVAIVIGGNALWALTSFALLFGHLVSPNLLGEAFIAMQALAVGVIAELQYIGLRKSSAPTAAV
jgi:hypothetical protein